jgi:hypothetical protein
MLATAIRSIAKPPWNETLIHDAPLPFFVTRRFALPDRRIPLLPHHLRRSSAPEA